MRTATCLLVTSLGLGCSCTRKEVPATSEPPRETLRLVQGEPKTLAGGTTLLLTRYVVEEIAGDPNDPKGLPAGEAVVTSVRVDGQDIMLSEAPPGYGGHSEAWTRDLRVRLVSADILGEVGVLVDRRTDRVVSERTARVERGQSTALDDNRSMRFAGHGHKTVSPGQKSPLIVHVEYHAGGELVEQPSHSIDPDEKPIWRWRDFEIEVKDYKYDQFMELAIRRLGMEPIQ